MKLVDIIFEFLKGKGVDPYECHPECPDCSNNSQYEGIDCWCIPLYDRDRWRNIAEELYESVHGRGNPSKAFAKYREAIENGKNY